MTTIKFFMIGSWTEGMMHFNKLAPYIASCEAASVHATAYFLPIGFPILTNSQTCRIPGQLIKMHYDSTVIALLDTMHGVHPNDPLKGLHHREQTLVLTQSGATETAYVYFFNKLA